jgi:hemolysin activation/secretion protein
LKLPQIPSNNDRLPGARRNFFTDPTTPPPICACRASSTLRTDGAWNSPLSLSTCSIALNARYRITDEGLMNNQASFNYGTKKLGINYFPAYYQVPTNFMKAASAYAPRQIQFALRLGF